MMAAPMTATGSSAPLKPVRYNRLVQQDISKPMDGTDRVVIIVYTC